MRKAFLRGFIPSLFLIFSFTAGAAPRCEISLFADPEKIRQMAEKLAMIRFEIVSQKDIEIKKMWLPEFDQKMNELSSLVGDAEWAKEMVASQMKARAQQVQAQARKNDRERREQEDQRSRAFAEIREWRYRVKLPRIHHNEQLVLLPDGNKILMASEWHTARILDLQTMETETPGGQGLFIKKVAFSNDGSIMASFFQNKLRVFDLTNEKEIEIPDCSFQTMSAVAVTPDGSQVIIAGNPPLNGFTRNDTEVKILDLVSNSFRDLPDKHQFEVGQIVITKDGSQVMTFSVDGDVHLTDLKIMKRLRLPWWLKFNKDFNRALLSPDGNRLAAFGNRRLKILDMKTRKLLFNVPFEPYNLHAAQFSPDSSNLILVNGQIHQFNLNKNFAETVWPYPSDWSTNHVSLSQDGSELFYGNGNLVKKRTLSNGTEKTIFSRGYTTRESSGGSAVSADGNKLLFINRDMDPYIFFKNFNEALEKGAEAETLE